MRRRRLYMTRRHFTPGVPTAAMALLFSQRRQTVESAVKPQMMKSHLK